MESTRIIQKKSKPIFLAVILFLGLGVGAEWLLFKVVFPMLEGFWKLKITAVAVVAAVVIFGIVAVAKQGSKKKPGLVIHEGGIEDNSNFLAVEEIPWKEIRGVRGQTDGFKRTFLVIDLVDPDKYIDRGDRWTASRMATHRQFGSPVVILPGNLDCDPVQLKKWLVERIRSK